MGVAALDMDRSRVPVFEDPPGRIQDLIIGQGTRNWALTNLGSGELQRRSEEWEMGTWCGGSWWVARHVTHEGPWLGRHGRDRTGTAWHGRRPSRPGGPCTILRGQGLDDEPWCHGEKPGRSGGGRSRDVVVCTLDQHRGEEARRLRRKDREDGWA